MKEIIFDNVEKRYGENVVIPQLNLKVEPGERLILLGPSGCGKSTTLRMIAGLEEISSGNLIMNERVVNDVARAIVMFQWFFKTTLFILI